MRVKSSIAIGLMSLCMGLTIDMYAAAYSIPSITAPSDIREDLTWYSDKRAGVMFAYPKRFTTQANPDAETMVKVSGVTGAGLNGEIQLNMSVSDAAVDTVGKALAEALQKQIPTYQPGKLEWVRFGRNLKLNGVTRVADLSVGAAKFKQRVTHFAHNGRVYTFTMLGPQSQWAALDPIYNFILLSVAPYGSSGGSASAPRGESGNKEATGFSNFYKKGIGSFAYPASWKVQDEFDPNVLVKITGTDSSGRGGEIQLSHHAAWDASSLQQFADLVEKTYLKPQKNWARLTDSSFTFGAGTRMEGMRRSGSMLVNGADAMSHTAYWTSNGHNYCFSMTTLGYSRQDADALFNKAIQTLNIDPQAGTITGD